MKKLITYATLLLAVLSASAQHDVYVWKGGTYTSIEQADSVTYRNPANSVAKKRYTLPGGVDFNMVSVKGGTFLMGAQKDDATKPNYDPNAGTNESPVHTVTVSDFAIGETEVTKAMYTSITGSYDYSIVPRCSLSYDNVIAYIAKLNVYMHATGQISDEQNFCLPTEAEWEYAARGGQYSHGYIYAGSWTLDSVGTKSLSNVKTKQPNELGLYDMSSNAYEWCADWYGANYYAESDGSTDPTGPTTGSSRVLRGGYSSLAATYCRVSDRNSYSPSHYSTYGFRLSLK